MTTHKRISGDYIITTIQPQDYTRVNTHTLEVNGNLNVRGNLTYIEVSELKVDDPFITVAANNTGVLSNALFQNQGVVAQTSANTFAGIRFNNPSNEWEISPDVTASGDPIVPYQAIGTAAAGAPGGDITDIQFKAAANAFGGNNSFQFDSANSLVQLSGYLALGNVPPPLIPTANAVTLHSAQEGSGGTGVYVRSAAVNDELVSRSAAIVFSIIF